MKGLIDKSWGEFLEARVGLKLWCAEDILRSTSIDRNIIPNGTKCCTHKSSFFLKYLLFRDISQYIYICKSQFCKFPVFLNKIMCLVEEEIRIPRYDLTTRDSMILVGITEKLNCKQHSVIMMKIRGSSIIVNSG